jgi:hypothetical protein
MTLPTGLYVDSEMDAPESRRAYRNSQDEDNASTFDLAASEGVRLVRD